LGIGQISHEILILFLSSFQNPSNFFKSDMVKFEISKTLNFRIFPKSLRLKVVPREPIFQKYPFVVVKDIYENHQIMEMQYRGYNEWISVESFDHNELSKIAGWSVAVSDSAGNQAKYHYDRLPDDIYVDNEDESFRSIGEVQLLDHNSANLFWGRNTAKLAASEGLAQVTWSHQIARSAHYDAFIRFPLGVSMSSALEYALKINGSVRSQGTLSKLSTNRWILLDDLQLQAGDEIEIQLFKEAEMGQEVTFLADAVKLSAYRKPVFLQAQRAPIDLGQVLKQATIPFDVLVENKGYEDAFVTKIESELGQIVPQENLQIALGANEQKATLFLLVESRFRGHLDLII
jgi:hypothetical protein